MPSKKNAALPTCAFVGTWRRCRSDAWFGLIAFDGAQRWVWQRVAGTALLRGARGGGTCGPVVIVIVCMKQQRRGRHPGEAGAAGERGGGLSSGVHDGVWFHGRQKRLLHNTHRRVSKTSEQRSRSEPIWIPHVRYKWHWKNFRNHFCTCCYNLYTHIAVAISSFKGVISKFCHEFSQFPMPAVGLWPTSHTSSLFTRSNSILQGKEYKLWPTSGFPIYAPRAACDTRGKYLRPSVTRIVSVIHFNIT